jgi:hypothetical protein
MVRFYCSLDRSAMYAALGKGRMMFVNLSPPDLPQVQPGADPQACLQAAVHGHVNPPTGSPCWLNRAQALDVSR